MSSRLKPTNFVSRWLRLTTCVVTLPDDRAYTLFAETMDRSGYARGTLGPRKGMSAAVPAQRRRPMLTMADMGMMMHDGGGMAGMEGENQNHGGMHHDMTQPDTDHPHGKELPTTNLVQRIKHGPDQHGPGSITMAKTAYRRLDYPGAGLGEDGWRVLTYSQLRALKEPYGRRPPTRQFDLHLTGNMHKYVWGFDGKKWSESNMIRFQYGERLRINMINDTMMSHPIHLHGMWMDLYAGADNYGDNPRKHTVIVQPAELLTVDITVDAPGQWAFHCHLLYHMERGMFRTVAVVRSLEGGPSVPKRDLYRRCQAYLAIVVLFAFVLPTWAQQKSELPSTADRPMHDESAAQHAGLKPPAPKPPTGDPRRNDPRRSLRLCRIPAARRLSTPCIRRRTVHVHAL